VFEVLSCGGESHVTKCPDRGLVSPKNHTVWEKKCEVVYGIHCRDCEKDYIGETVRTFEIGSRSMRALKKRR